MGDRAGSTPVIRTKMNKPINIGLFIFFLLEGNILKTEQILSKNYRLSYSTNHYDFFCKPHSYAFKNIKEIARYQEECYNNITEGLKIFINFKIKYFLADSPQEVGFFYGDNQACNGFASLPDKIFAVYNEHLKCTGMHEDVHIISYSVKKPKSNFIGEGLAMYFDKTWQGVDNIVLCKQILKNNTIKFNELFDNDSFFSVKEDISYPLAGGITSFFINKFSMAVYLEKIFYNDDFINFLNEFFGKQEEFTKIFTDWILNK
ncbi:MAG: hypothetical protein LUI60_05710 [Clostridia bacterium]|nr:hypothetical protein [Clostridia bacterium]